MFHGGTNFGFYNGANTQPELPTYGSVTTSYDYDALLTENGDYTEKFELVRGILMDFHERQGRGAAQFGARPEAHSFSLMTEFPLLEATEAVSLFDLLDILTRKFACDFRPCYAHRLRLPKRCIYVYFSSHTQRYTLKSRCTWSILKSRRPLATSFTESRSTQAKRAWK
jgi:hypothetical protein